MPKRSLLLLSAAMALAAAPAIAYELNEPSSIALAVAHRSR